MSSEQITIFTDGASRGNPGPAAIAYVIQRSGQPDIAHGETIGIATNNFAEYTAMIRALAEARGIGAKTIRLHSDSELMVRQLRGEYRVKNPDIQLLHDEAHSLIRHFKKVDFIHVRREMNSQADRLCNDALDGRRPTAPKLPDAVHRKPSAELPAAPEVAEILQLLAEFRDQWSHDEGPEVEAAWAELHKLLKKHKMLRVRKTKKE